MFTSIGKFLVIINFAASIMLAALTLGIVTNRIDWAGSATPGEAKGLHESKMEEIKVKQNTFLLDRARWKAEEDTLLALEAKRPFLKDWYAEQLKILKTGKDARNQPVDPAVKLLAYDNNGRLKTDANGIPLLAPHPDKQYKDQKTLGDLLARKENDIKVEIEDIHRLIKLQEEKTLELQGDPGKTKGLLALLEESLRDQKNALEEFGVAQREATNGRVAVQSLLRRQLQLQARVRELKNVGVAVREP